MSALDNYKYIFISGLHCSGTSLLFRILREHPDVSGFSDTGVPQDEGQFLQTVFKPAKSYGGVGKFALNKGSYLDETSPLVTPDNREKIFQEWSSYWDLGKPYLLEKSPPNIVRTRFLQAIFPGAFFITITRHPVAVLLSSQKWRRTHLIKMMENYCRAHEIFSKDKHHLQYHMEFKYEDMVANAEVSFGEIYNFLGLKPVGIPEKINQQINAKYFNRWKDRAKKSFWNWLLFRLIEIIYEKRINRFGYSFRDI